MSNNIDESTEAFPLQHPSGAYESGMKLRDYFAAAALTGLLADGERSGTWLQYADDAYKAADAMLKKREHR